VNLSHRLFIAIDPPPSAIEGLGAVTADLEVTRAAARVTPPDRWHLTVTFLGDVEAGRLAAAATALDRACAAPQLRELLPAALALGGGGTFGRGRFTILWARVGGDTAAVRALSGVLRRELRRAKLPFDDKPYRPHLTLARPGDRVTAEAIARDVERLDGYAGPSWPIDAVHLYESEFLNTPTGVQPRYTRQHTVAL
jgi:2'-5' RNA ligase